ncbi:MAG: hypothetical protein ABIJ45_01965 [Candidatus Zixiibacteriota bacterium]
MSKKINSSEKSEKYADIKSDLNREPVTDYEDNGAIFPFEKVETLDDNKVFIECPGATVYEEGTRNVIAGVEFIDESDPQKGYRIIDQPVYAPEHRKRRMIKKDHINSIRRCQACQDLTVRLIRREGEDFFIPSPKHPRKTKLKSVEKNW